MKKTKIAIIPGDGIGQEVISESIKLIDYFNLMDNLSITYEIFNWDANFYLEHGHMLKDEDIELLESEYNAILFGAIGDPRIPDMEHGRELLLKLRQDLNLYINFRPIRCLNSALSPLKEELTQDINMVIFRENTQGIYCQIGGTIKDIDSSNIAIDSAIYSQKNIEQFITAAFEWAVKNQRKHIDLVDKANAVTNIGKLWRKCFNSIAKRFPSITTQMHYIDAYCQKMVLSPQSIDVVVSSNLFGDILGDLGAGIVGGLGLTESANMNPETGFALFEPTHGSAPDIAGLGIANPIASFYSLALLLKHIDCYTQSEKLSNALNRYLSDENSSKTPDLGGTASTQKVTNEILAIMCQEHRNG